MTSVRVIDNFSSKLGSVLVDEMGQAKGVRIAVACISVGGLDVIRMAVRQVLDTGGYVEFLIGMDLVTAPQALDELYDLAQQQENAALYCYSDLTPSGIYHPKLYIVEHLDEMTALVGSSNLTKGGLAHNAEVNVLLKVHLDTAVASDLWEAYNRLKFHPARVEPDAEFLDIYKRLHREQKKQRRSGVMADLVTKLKQKAGSLRHPVPTTRDLIGWLKMVYDRLPDGEFGNQDVYAFEQEFRARYPDNKNVNAKIRQQLQVLRDMGLVRHLGPGRWEKEDILS